MNYKETTEYLFKQLPVFQQVGGSAYKEGLDNSHALDKLFEYPHKSFKTIHVAGTNGKGSTSHLLAAILQESGYKVGLYTSPHLVDFRERIRVNGEKISEQYVIDFVAKNKNEYEKIEPSFFELTMFMTFCYFEKMAVDVAIIEVGLGGRLDSTNIITPDLCIITNIGLDHVQFLGDTSVKIAKEKAGIIKPSIPVVIGEAMGDVKEVFREIAIEQNAPIIFAEESSQIEASRLENNQWLFETKDFGTIVGELGGFAQLKNANTVLNGVKELRKIGYTIPLKAVTTGFGRVVELTGLMGRWQIIQESPKIICDTGHNVAGMQYIVEQLKNEKYSKLHIVIGMVNDKDISHVLELLPSNAIYYFVKANIARALSTKDLKQIGSSYSLDGKEYTTINDSIIEAKKNASKDDLIFIGGSNFVVGEALEFLQD